MITTDIKMVVNLAVFLVCSCIMSVAPSPQSASDDFEQFDVAGCEPSASTYTASANVPAHSQPGIKLR